MSDKYFEEFLILNCGRPIWDKDLVLNYVGIHLKQETSGHNQVGRKE